MNEIQYLEIPREITEDEVNSYLTSQNIFNVTQKTITFPNKEDAIEYLSELVKEDKSIIVKYEKVVSDITENKGYQDLCVRVEELETNLRDFPNLMLEKLRTQTSNSRGCKKCKSSFNREFLLAKLEKIEELNINDLFCPMCEDSDLIISNTEHKRLANLLTKIESFKSKLKEKERKLLAKADKEDVLLVGYIGKSCELVEQPLLPEETSKYELPAGYPEATVTYDK